MRQREAVVPERAAGELAGLSGADGWFRGDQMRRTRKLLLLLLLATSGDGGEHGFCYRRAAVDVEFEDVFAGDAVGGGEVKDEGAGVEDGGWVRWVVEGAHGCGAGFGERPIGTE